MVAFGTDFKANWMNDFVIRMEWDDATSSHDELLVYLVKTDSFAHVMEKTSAPLSDAFKMRGGTYVYKRTQSCCCCQTTLLGRDKKRHQRIKRSLPSNIHGHFKKLNIPLGAQHCHEIQHETYGSVLVNWLNPATFLFIHPAYDHKELYVYDKDADGWWAFPDQKGTIWATRHKNKKTHFFKRLELDEILVMENKGPTAMPVPAPMTIQGRGSTGVYTEEQMAKIKYDVSIPYHKREEEGEDNKTSESESESEESLNEEIRQQDYKPGAKTEEARKKRKERNRRRSSVAMSPTGKDDLRDRRGSKSAQVQSRSSLTGAGSNNKDGRNSSIKSVGGGTGSGARRRSSTVHVENMDMVMRGREMNDINNGPLDRIRRTSGKIEKRRRSSVAGIDQRQFVTNEAPADMDFK